MKNYLDSARYDGLDFARYDSLDFARYDSLDFARYDRVSILIIWNRHTLDMTVSTSLDMTQGDFGFRNGMGFCFEESLYFNFHHDFVLGLFICYRNMYYGNFNYDIL